MSVYAATFSAVSVSAAQDLFEITTPSNRSVRLREIRIGQYSDAGDASAELLSLLLISGFTVSGSGGASATPASVNGVKVPTSTVERNNTTVANTGTTKTLLADVWNVQAPWFWIAPDSPSDPGNISISPSSRLVLRITAPADAITMNGTLLFEEPE